MATDTNAVKVEYIHEQGYFHDPFLDGIDGVNLCDGRMNCQRVVTDNPNISAFVEVEDAENGDGTLIFSIAPGNRLDAEKLCSAIIERRSDEGRERSCENKISKGLDANPETFEVRGEYHFKGGLVDLGWGNDDIGVLQLLQLVSSNVVSVETLNIEIEPSINQDSQPLRPEANILEKIPNEGYIGMTIAIILIITVAASYMPDIKLGK